MPSARYDSRPAVGTPTHKTDRLLRYCTLAAGHFLNLLAPADAVDTLRTGREY